MIKIAVSMGPQPGLPLTLMQQCGVEHAVGGISLQPIVGASDDEQPWSRASLERAAAAYDQNGFKLSVIESRPPMEKIKLALPGRDHTAADTASLASANGQQPADAAAEGTA